MDTHAACPDHAGQSHHRGTGDCSCGRNHRGEWPRPLPLHRTEAGYPNCSTCDGGGCYDCTDPA